MRHKLFLTLSLSLVPFVWGQQPPKADFPLTVTIETASDFSLKLPAEEEVKDATMGIAPPGLLMFRGTINGEHHWIFTCRKEVSGRESVPCTIIPTGEYRGRWVHDTNMLQIVGGEGESPTMRFLMVIDDPKNPPTADDPVLHVAAYDFGVAFPNGESLNSFPYLIHVYGSVSMELPAGTLPGRVTCNESTWNPIQTTVNCTSLPPVEIHRGYVTVDFSAERVGMASMHCEAKWRWSHCSVLAPGFYYARAGDNKMLVLTHDENGKPKEIGFDVNMPADTTRSPIK